MIENLEGEIWRDVIGYENSHEVSNLGRIRSKTRIVQHKGKDKIVYGMLLKPWIVQGYERTAFSKDGERVGSPVHRVVAQAFIPNPENKPQVNHKDGNKLNNCADNLEWTTAAENNRHAHATGLAVFKRGSECSGAKLNESIVSKIKKLLASGNFSYRQLSKEFNINRTTIARIDKNISWKHVQI